MDSAETEAPAERDRTRHDATSGRAGEALAIYLELGAERTLRRVHTELLSRYGKGEPYQDKLGRTRHRGGAPSFDSVEHWSATNDWVERAKAHDRDVFNREQERIKQEELDRAAERRKQRQLDQSIQRDYARGVLLTDHDWDQETQQFVPRANARARTKDELSPRDADAASRILSRVAENERLDFGEPTVQQAVEITGSDGGPVKIEQTLPVVDEDYLARARALVEKMEQAGSR